MKQDRIGFPDALFPNYYNLDAGYEGVSGDTIPFSKSIAWLASSLATQACITAYGTTDFHGDLAKFDVPTLVMHGSADRIVPLETSGKKTAALMKNSRLENIDGAPHGFAMTHSAKLNELLLDFLNE